MKNKIGKAVLPALLAASLASPTNAAVIELSLVVDSSGSISTSEFALQAGAYESIFSDSFVDNFINAGDQLFANLILFGTSAVEKIGFTAITDNAAAASFGAAIGAVTRTGATGSTDTEEATELATNIITTNGIASDRTIIDVSTDGRPNSTTNAIAAAAAANAAGVTVNAIGIGGGVGTQFLDDFTTAGGGFFVTANSFAEFEASLRTKLRREITGNPVPPPPGPGMPPSSVPEPGSLALIGLGLLGLARRARKQLSA